MAATRCRTVLESVRRAEGIVSDPGEPRLAASILTTDRSNHSHAHHPPPVLHAQISQNPLPTETVEDADFSTDEDPLDELSDDAPGIGLLVRTDYTDDAAWHAFHTKLQEAETEFSTLR